jgi:purine-binding chemotaxis protein CheW
MSLNPAIADAPATKLAGKYLTFRLAQESYGVDVLKVREIIRLQNITPVPRTHDYVKGVINLRGKIVPVIDLRKKFDLEVIECADLNCIVVVQVPGSSGSIILLGLIVDAVEEVANINAADIEPPPDFGTQLNTEFILGMAKTKAGVKTLLNIEKVIAVQLLEELEQG